MNQSHGRRNFRLQLAATHHSYPSINRINMLRIRWKPILRPSNHINVRFAHSSTRSLTSPTADDLAYFSKILPSSSIVSTFGSQKASEEDLEQYNADWMGKYRGKSQIVLRPRSTKDVSDILKHCWERKIGVVPQGGNTGLVGEFRPFPRYVKIFTVSQGVAFLLKMKLS